MIFRPTVEQCGDIDLFRYGLYQSIIRYFGVCSVRVRIRLYAAKMEFRARSEHLNIMFGDDMVTAGLMEHMARVIKWNLRNYVFSPTRLEPVFELPSDYPPDFSGRISDPQFLNNLTTFIKAYLKV